MNYSFETIHKNIFGKLVSNVNIPPAISETKAKVWCFIVKTSCTEMQIPK